MQSPENQNLANKLAAMHRTKNPFTQLPDYRYDQLRKGVVCGRCHSLSVSKVKNQFICENCHTEEMLESAILRTIDEFKLLFPGRKITTSGILDWCGRELNAKTISRILKNNFHSFGKTKDTYYE
ncbi:hypothetical protein D3H55_04670 [Bacillus salacetis]|uniref:Uncharacterized protein n=1 Tax=Bacillus salacetis TaxID=2315464 RepID=A0A3A1R3N0_9BACI|nr:hypothetical protein D3H55_04670 [Bacillus salacetis]